LSLPVFQLLRPRSLDEAVKLLAQHAGKIQILAGGTDLVPSLRQQLFAPAYVLDLRGIEELRGVRVHENVSVEIGALTPLSAIEDSEFIRRNYPVLHEAVAVVASPVIRNMATLGGNLCLDTRCLWYNQSLAWRKSCGFCIKSPHRANTGLAGGPEQKDGDLCHVAPGGTKCWAAFSGDTPPALLCLNAELEIAGPAGIRRLPLCEFYTNEGDNRMRLGRDELIARVYLPATSAGYRGAYRKLRVRGSIDYPLAGVAVALKLRNGSDEPKVEDARVAITAVNPAPMLIESAPHALIGRVVDEHVATVVGELAAGVARPLTTSALTPEYRREMVRVFARRAVLAAGA
jgi:4-hydroxybenzoyl-CoA reductase subunit beta